MREGEWSGSHNEEQGAHLSYHSARSSQVRGRENSHNLGGLLRKQCHWGAPRFGGTPKKKVKGTLTEKVESRGFAGCPSSPRGHSGEGKEWKARVNKAKSEPGGA